ncbi:MAG: response regulator [bacterium]
MIDDNPAHADMLRRKLQDKTVPWSFEVDSSLSVDDALETLSGKHYDLFIVDYKFPFGNGFTMLEKLRDEGYNTPAIMLTGKGNEKIAARAVKKNLHDYIPKDDMTTETLKKAIEGVLTDSRADVTSGQSGKSEPRQLVRYSSPDSLIVKLSRLKNEGKEFNLLLLKVTPKAGDETVEIDHASFIESAFQEIALDRIDFYTVRPDVIVGVLNKQLPEMVSIENPANSLPDQLRATLRAIQSVRNREDIPFSLTTGLFEITGDFADPVTIINNVLAKLDGRANDPSSESIPRMGPG